MKMPWQKDTPTPVATVKGRAAVVPKSYKFQWAKNVTENNMTVNSYSTVFTTVRVLKEGETAENTAQWQEGTLNFGDERVSVEQAEAEGMYRVQFDAPNWVGVIISQDGTEYVAHVELPVWIDPATGRVVGVDVPELVQQLEPKREQLSRIWGLEQGPFADFHQILQLPSTLIKTGKFFASLPGEWIGAVKDLAKDLKDNNPNTPLPPDQMPDMAQYGPIQGINFDSWVLMRCDSRNIAPLGFTTETFVAVDKEWLERLDNDEKLKVHFQRELMKARKAGTILK